VVSKVLLITGRLLVQVSVASSLLLAISAIEVQQETAEKYDASLSKRQEMDGC
jgi:hypothetical protein